MGENRYYQDLHVFDLKEGKWMTKAVQLATQKSKSSGKNPGMRSGFVMFADSSGGVYVWGGTREKGRGTETLCDMWRLDVKELEWERVDAGSGPGMRSGVAVCAVANLGALVCGGVQDRDSGDSVFLVESWFFDFGKKAWISLGEGEFGGRRNCGMIFCGGTGIERGGDLCVCVFGGLREEGKGKREREKTLDDVWKAELAFVEGSGGVSLRAWKCALPLSGEGDTWAEDSGSDSEGEEEGEEQL